MTENQQKRQGMWGWGIFASFLVHAAIAFVILVGLPLDLPRPEAEETVSVEIVPPPEEQEAEAPKPAETPPAPEQEKAAAPPPEKPAEQGEPPPPPPPPPPAAEEPQQKAEEQPAPPQEAADTSQAPEASPPLDNFRPVFQFGEKDSGPKQSVEGSAAKEEAATEDTTSEQAEADVASDTKSGGVPDLAEQKPSPSPPDTEQKADVEATEKTAGPPVPEDIALPDVGLGLPASETEGMPKLASVVDDAVKADMAPAKPNDTDKAGGGVSGGAEAAVSDAKPQLRKAKKLFSTSVTDNPMATIALGTMSRGERAGELCNSELGAQLAHGAPRYLASRLPKPHLRTGNVIDVQTAFSTRSQWYDVSFRCEVDKDAMKVVSFAYDVGAAIPKNEWKKRRLPSPF